MKQHGRYPEQDKTEYGLIGAGRHVEAEHDQGGKQQEGEPMHRYSPTAAAAFSRNNDPSRM